MRSPAFQVYAKGELTDTAHLSNHEVGLYLRLRCAVWAYTEDFHTCDWDMTALADALQTTPRTLKALIRKLGRPPARLVVKEKNRIRLPVLEEQAIKQETFRNAQSANARRRWRQRKTSSSARTDDTTPRDSSPSGTSDAPASAPASGSSGKHGAASREPWLPVERAKWLRLQKQEHRAAWADSRRAAALEKHSFKWVVAAYIGAMKMAPKHATAEDVVRLTFGILRKGTPPDDTLDEAARRIRALDRNIPGVTRLGERL